MQRVILFFALIGGSFGPSLFAACQQPAPSGTLEEQLRATYSPAVLDGNEVLRPGCMLVVQMNGIIACNSSLTATRSVYENGQISAETKSSLVNFGKKIPGLGSHVPDAPSCPVGQSRYLVMTEKVYLVRLEIPSKGTGIVFSVQSCGTCDPAAPDPAQKPYFADVRVALNKGFLTSSTLAQVEKVVGEVLAFPADGAAVSMQQVSQPEQPTAPPPAWRPVGGGAPPVPPPASPQPSYAPIPPPAPASGGAPLPPAPRDADDPGPPILRRGTPASANPPVVSPPNPSPADMTGQTPDQVKAALGQPDGIAKIGSKEIYSYKNLNLKVIFVDGRVSDIE
jgi:hypothetical protein